MTKAVRKVHSPIQIGDRIGKWTVLGDGDKRGKHVTKRCRCQCGAEVNVLTFTLKSGESRSCRACRPVVLGGKPALKHGMCYSAEYHSWNGMRFRCGNPNDPQYSAYGGRGISVCPEWNASFEAFYRDMGPKPVGRYSIDRIDVNGNYEPKTAAGQMIANKAVISVKRSL